MFARKLKYIAVTISTLIVGALPAIVAISAEGISPQMSCKSVRLIFDAPEPNMTEVREVFLVVDSEFAALDRKNLARSRPQIYARMNSEGKKNISAIVTARCDEHPNDSIRKSVQEAYKVIEEMGDVIGVND